MIDGPSADVFERLAPFVQSFVYKKAWTALRPVQVETARAVFDSNHDVLVMTGTASGKTEAAFLPILSEISEAPARSVQVLYVAPLKALINDQFQRLQVLCDEADIPVHRWHGDVSADLKSLLLKSPGGVLQTTPESIESLLINRTAHLPRLFADLRFVVVDEMHSFMAADRGVQLRNQILRLTRYARSGRPRVIALSATIGDVDIAREWLRPDDTSCVTIVNPPGVVTDTRISHLHFEGDTLALPQELVADAYQITAGAKSLMFCNARNAVEQLTHKLNKQCARDNRPERYL